MNEEPWTFLNCEMYSWEQKGARAIWADRGSERKGGFRPLVPDAGPGPLAGVGLHQGRGEVNARKIGSVCSWRQAQGPNGFQSGHRPLWGHTGHLGVGRCHFIVFLSA